MQPLRLAIVTARFWPLVGDDERQLLRLAEGLIAQSQKVQVVAAAWKKSWPAEMCVGTARLVRLRGSPKSSLATLRWMYSLNRWLKDHAGELDAVLVAGLRQEAYVAVRALAEAGVPVIALAQQCDLDWQRTATFGSRIARRTRAAAGIIAGSRFQAEILARGGYDKQRIRVLPPAVELPLPRSPVRQGAARESLGTTNHDLIATDITPIALAVGRLDERSRFGDLVRAWRIVTARRHDARLWIAGDGPERERLYRQICDLDLKSRVLLPGTFDSPSELLQAADLFVQPASCEAAPAALYEALADGLPVVAGDCLGIREILEPGQTGTLVPPGDPKQLAAAIEHLFGQPAKAVTLGSAARDWSRRQPRPAEQIGKLATLVREVLSTEY